MNIQITITELYERGLLDKFCEVMKIPEGIIPEKQWGLGGNDRYELTVEQAEEIGLINRRTK